MPTARLIKDQPFIHQSSLTGHWYFVQSWRDLGNDIREAHIKWDITDQIESIITAAKEG
jgi:hypothetical protein